MVLLGINMSIAFTNIFLVIIFILLAGKWIVTGYIGRIAGQLTFLFPLSLFLYLSMITVSVKNHFTNPPFSSSRLLQYKGKKQQNLRLSKEGKLQAVLLFLYLLILSIGLFRTVGVTESFTLLMMAGRSASIIVTAMVGYFIFRSYIQYRRLDRIWIIITMGLGLYIIINIIGLLAGIKNPFVESLHLIKTDTVLSFWDIRMSFPFSANYQAFALEAGLLGVLVISQLLQPGCRYRYGYVFILLLTIGLIITTNTRAPLMALIVTMIVGMTWKKRGKKLLLPALVILLVLPIFFTYVDILPGLESLSIDLSILTRKQDLSGLATLNNRTIIWRHAFKEFKYLKAIHFVGFGAFGHIVTGMSYDYAFMWRDPELISLHNTYLQHLIDFGYIGLFVLIAIIVNAIIVLSRYKVNLGTRSILVLQPALASMIYLAVCSVLGISIYFQQTLSFLIFMFINFQVIWYNPTENRGRLTQKTL